MAALGHGGRHVPDGTTDTMMCHYAILDASGPRTMEQLESQLSGADITLSADIPDRIDELVAPGVTVNPDDNSYGETELTLTARRRHH